MHFRQRPFESWERKFRRIAEQRIASDRGVGDTIFRLRGDEGLRAFNHKFRSVASSISILNLLYKFPYVTRADETAKLTAMRCAGLGRTLVIVANGPSHYEAQLESLVGVPGIDMLTVNRPYQAIWPTKYWLFFDPSVRHQNMKTFCTYRGVVFTGGGTRMDTGNTIFLRGAYRFGHDVNKGVMIRTEKKASATTTAAAIQLAAYMAYDRVFVVGADLGAGADGKLYPWGSNPVCRDEVRVKRFPDEGAVLDKCGEELAGNAARFTFCSSYAIAGGWPFLRWFNAIPHQNAAYAILKAAEGVRANPRTECPEIPRRLAPAAIGEDFDQKVERDRMIDGGCCGAPTLQLARLD